MIFMKSSTRAIFLFLIGAAFPGAGSAASPDPDRTRQLLAVVQSKAELADRARALQQLALVATKDAVGPVATLLADAQLGQYARDVLEQMPDPAAGEALRGALGQLRGNALIGVINSLGIRRDVAAVDALTRFANGNSAELIAPAMLALGRIGSPEALRVIETAVSRGTGEQRVAAAEACLVAADRESQAGNLSPARRLFGHGRRTDLPLPIQVAAIRGVIATSGNAALTIAIEQLRSKELALRDVGLLAVRELPDPQVTPRLVAELDRLPPSMQALVITALVDRGDASALPAIEARTKATDAEVRLAAVRGLGRIGGASSLPLLLETVRAGADPTAAAAVQSLTRIPAAETNAFLLRALAGADPALQVKLIGILGERRADSATADFLKRAAAREPEVSQAALRALGQVARPADLPQLIALAVTLQDDAAKTLADRAIVMTSMKVLQPGQRAEAVLVVFRQESQPATKAALVRPLAAIVRSMGGHYDAFAALHAAVRKGSAPVREAALRALADWPDATPTMPLLAMVSDPKSSPAEREVALSGAIRLATQVAAGRERSPLDVVEAFTQANRAVTTKAEKLMIVSGLGQVKRAEAARMLQPYLNDPDVSSEAALALVQVAPALLASKEGAQVRGMLEKIATSDPDETVRQKAGRLAKGTPPSPAKEKAKGKKAAATSPAAGAAAVPELFDGKDLGGWDGDPAVWRVRDGAIVGGSLEGNPRNEFLATTRAYRNFVLRLEYKLVGTEGFVNGGVQFRSVRIPQPPNEMSGYQADIGAGHSGCLYDESRRRKFLARATDEQIKRLEKPGDWNRYEIRCDGAKVELSLNGEKTVAYTEDDPSVKPEGLIALQIHGNCKAEIAFRNLEVTELP